MTFEQWWAGTQQSQAHSLIKFSPKQIAAGAWNRAVSEVMMKRKDVNWDDPDQDSINTVFTRTPDA